MAKHYIRLDNENNIIKGFSTDFEESLEKDICINENGGRHFELFGEVNHQLTNYDFENKVIIYFYKYENGEIKKVVE